jgi:hypothetical protein
MSVVAAYQEFFCLHACCTDASDEGKNEDLL